jgi:hypothetical protein
MMKRFIGSIVALGLVAFCMKIFTGQYGKFIMLLKCALVY